MSGVDAAKGGPFLVFMDEYHGWKALARRLMQLRNQGKKTVREVIGIWAPPNENHTDSYVAFVAKALKVTPDSVVQIANFSVLCQISAAIARQEGIASDKWSEQDRARAVHDTLERYGVKGG